MRLRLLASVLIISLLAGCFGNGGSTQHTGTSAPTPDQALTFSTPVAVGAGSEPGLLITNGTLWAHAPGHLYRSNNGTFWAEVSPGPALAVFGNDAEMVKDAEGTLYYSDLQLTASLAVYYSNDDGLTWTYQPIASMLPAVDRQWMATGPDAGPLAGSHSATYLTFNQLSSSPWVTKSTDGGQTWKGVIVDPTQPAATFWAMGNILVDPTDGAVFLSWVVGYAGEGVGPTPPVVEYKIRYAASFDGGLTWQANDGPATRGNAGHLFSVLAQDDAGRLYMTWAELVGDHQEVMLSSSGDRGATWTPGVKVSGNGTAVMPWIDAGKPGQVVVAWYGNNATAPSSQADGDWFVYAAQSFDANTTAPTFTTVQVTAEPMRNGAICTVGIACTGDRQLADFFQVRLDSEGQSHIVYADTEHGDGTTTYYTRQVSGPTL